MSGSRLGRIALSVALATALVLALAACTGGATSGSSSGGTGSAGSGAGSAGSGSSSVGGATITEQNFQFSPSSLTVARGEKVSFVNQDSVPHHVVVGTTDLGVQQPGATVTWSSSEDRTFAVKCLIHPSMVGQITVGEGGGSSGGSGGSGGSSNGGSSGGNSGGGSNSGGAGGYGY